MGRAKVEFAALDPKGHDRKSFDCGVPALNKYLQRYANQDLKRSLTRIYVLAEGPAIVGYYSISAHSVRRDHLPEDVQAGPYEDIPFLLLGRLAVLKPHKRRLDCVGLGRADMRRRLEVAGSLHDLPEQDLDAAQSEVD